jgi:hypothetical protein
MYLQDEHPNKTLHEALKTQLSENQIPDEDLDRMIRDLNLDGNRKVEDFSNDELKSIGEQFQKGSDWQPGEAYEKGSETAPEWTKEIWSERDSSNESSANDVPTDNS